MRKFQGRVAVVTGGSSGIGLATAKRFVEEGAFVYITGRRQAELDRAVSLIGLGVTSERRTEHAQPGAEDPQDLLGPQIHWRGLLRRD